MIDAENVLVESKDVKSAHKRPIASQSKSGTSTRKFRSQAASTVAKEFGYINERDDEDQSNSSTESSAQQDREVEKQKDSAKKIKPSKKQIW